MGVHEARGNLSKAFKEMMTRWLEARQGWDDVRSEQFETEYLQQLESDLRTAGSAMDQIGTLIREARRDCE